MIVLYFNTVVGNCYEKNLNSFNFSHNYRTIVFVLLFSSWNCLVLLLCIQDHKHVANTGLCNLEFVIEQYSSFNH